MDPRLNIIYEDEELLAVNKPAGLVCHPTKGDVYSSLISRVRLHLGEACRPQLINRLDRETSGVTLITKDLASARVLRRLWEAREVQKQYWAIVHGHVRPEQMMIDAPLGKDTSSRVAIKDCVTESGAVARTEVWVEKRFVAEPSAQPADTGEQAAGLGQPRGAPAGPSGSQSPSDTPGEAQPFSLLRVVPLTGRKHQIRIHLAHVGHPLVGDKLYGGDEDLYLALVEDRLTAEQWSRLILPYHALHAGELRFEWRGCEKVLRAPPEPWFARFASWINGA
ncbi:MAG TPA: RluA family pseudouridine synthase [Verrucomicrobiae bacterium]|nr:RluA family pseudouridine synthase [Verrucomicrobiae bacterium]